MSPHLNIIYFWVTVAYICSQVAFILFLNTNAVLVRQMTVWWSTIKCHTGWRWSASARNRSTRPPEASLKTETMRPGCFAPNSIHFRFRANSLWIVHGRSSVSTSWWSWKSAKGLVVFKQTIVVPVYLLGAHWLENGQTLVATKGN